MGTQPVQGRQGSMRGGNRQASGTRQVSMRAPTAGRSSAPVPAFGGSKSSSGTIATYNGSGNYLGDAAIKALPKANQQSLMPGYNIFGDGMFFGEGMLKGSMVEVCLLPLLPRFCPPSAVSLLCPLLSRHFVCVCASTNHI